MTNQVANLTAELAKLTEKINGFYWRRERAAVAVHEVTEMVTHALQVLSRQSTEPTHSLSPLFSDSDLREVKDLAFGEISAYQVEDVNDVLAMALVAGIISHEQQRADMYRGLGLYQYNKKLYNAATRAFFESEGYWPAAYDPDWSKVVVGPPMAFTIESLNGLLREGQVGLYSPLPGQVPLEIADDHAYRKAGFGIGVLMATTPSALFESGVEAMEAFEASDRITNLMAEAVLQPCRA